MMLSVRTGEKMVPVLYCDLDGTVRKGKDELGRFVNGPRDVELFDGMGDLLWQYKNRGWRVVAITNQGGIALGHMSVEDCVSSIVETQKQAGGAFDKIMICPHYPGEGVEPEMATCWCRKPRPGMVIEAAFEMVKLHDEIYPPHLGLMVGDRPEDEQCAENAGLRFMHAIDWRNRVHLQEIM